MASKIRPKNPDAPAQPAAKVEAPKPAPTHADAEVTPSSAAERIAANAERLRETLETLSQPDPDAAQPEHGSATAEAQEPSAELQQAVADVQKPTRPSVLQRRLYEATYGQRIEDLCMRHGLARTSEAGRYLASQREKLKMSVREDVLCPVLLDGERKTVDQLVTLLVERDESELAEKLVADLKRYRSDKVSRALIFSFAAQHLAELEEAEYEAEMGRDPASSWAEAGAPVPAAEEV